MRSKLRFMILITIGTLAAAVMGMTSAGAQTPSGERQLVVVLFTNAAAANTHITTEAQLDAAIEAGDAFTVETTTIFHCDLVSVSTYNRATPLPPAAP